MFARLNGRREQEPEGGSGSGLALDHYLPSMRHGEPPGDRESKTAARWVFLTGLVGAVKAVEYLGDLVVGHPGAGVPDLRDDAVIIACNGKMDGASRW